MKQKQIEICAQIVGETARAFLITDDGRTQKWIPKSQVQPNQDSCPGDTVIFAMPEWLAIEKELV